MKNIVKRYFKKQTGDTIVEVMLAIIVIGGTLGGAFAIANRSTKTTQANYERYQAQVIANNQAELLKQKMNLEVSPPATKVMHNSFNDTSVQECLDNGGKTTSCDSGTIPYKIDISCLDVVSLCTPGSTYNNYKIRVEWGSLNGGKDNVELFYGV